MRPQESHQARVCADELHHLDLAVWSFYLLVEGVGHHHVAGMTEGRSPELLQAVPPSVIGARQSLVSARRLLGQIRFRTRRYSSAPKSLHRQVH